MNKMNITAQLYTVKEFTKTPKDIEETLKKVKRIGYNAIQVSGFGPIEPEKLKSLAEDIGLKICVTHTAYNRLINDLDNVIREHKLWDCENIGLGSMPKEFRTRREGYDEFIKIISPIAEKITNSGLKFVYHNHKFEFEKYDGITGLEILFNETNPETFCFEIDTYWVQAGGANPVEWIKKVEGRMDVVHFKDMAIKDNEQIFAEIGEGNLDWRSIIKVCRETGVKWYAVEQDKCLRDPFESLEMSFKYLMQYV